MAVRCLSQGCLFGGPLALQFGQNQRKKSPKQPTTCGVRSELTFSVGLIGEAIILNF